MIFLASSPERLVTVKCATDCRRRVFFLVSTAISVICIATRGAFRSMILMSLSFCFDTISPPRKMRSLCHWYEYFNPSCLHRLIVSLMAKSCFIVQLTLIEGFDMVFSGRNNFHACQLPVIHTC